MIKRNFIKNAPKPVGNYPHSIEINGIIYISGIGPRNYKTNEIPGNVYDKNKNLIKYDIKEQSHSVFANLKIILEESGGFVDFLEKDEKALVKKNIIATNSKIHQELKNELEKKY